MSSRFENLVLGEVANLVAQYNLTVANSDRSHGREDVLLKNDTTGIRFSWEPREREVFAMLVQLKDGEVPPYGSGWFDVADLVDVLGGEEVSHSADRRSLDRAVKKLGDLVETYCGCVLGGDFSLLPKIEEIQRQRAQAHE